MASLPLITLDDTRAVALRVAEALRPGDTVLLVGDLGTGKTTFAQQLIAALSEQPVEVTSPTFTLVQDYPVTLRDGTRTHLFHYDLYRIEQPSALVELGIDETESQVRVIEWPERLGQQFTPQSWICLRFRLDQGARTVSLQAGGHATQRLVA